MAETSSSTNTHTHQNTNTSSNISNITQSPILLLSNISNLISAKLDSTNYTLWKYQLLSIFESYSLLDHIDGSTHSPERYLQDESGAFTTQESVQYKQWKIRDQALKTLLNATLSPSALSLVLRQSTARGVWEVLERRSISCEELHVLLTSEEESKKNSKHMSSDVPHMAMAANASSPATNTPLPMFSSPWNRGRGGRSQNYRGRGRGNYGNSHGGFQQFPQNMQPNSPVFSQNSSTSQNSRPTCQICGKPGHVALDCFHRMNFAYQGRHPPAKLAAIASTNMSNAISAPTSTQSCWISDTGATDHFTPDITHIPDCHAYTGNDSVTVGNGQSLPITHTGNSQLRASTHLFNLRKVLHVPSMSSSLLSVYRFCKDNDASFYFDASKFHIKALRSGKLLYSGLSERGLYPVRGAILPTSVFFILCIFQHYFCSTMAHSAWSSPISKGKHHQLPFNDSVSITTRPLELVHTDVWGPAPVTSCNGTRYYVSFIDDFTRFTWFFPLKYKSQVLDSFKHFKSTMENILDCKIKLLRSDCGGEYSKSEFQSFCSSAGILHQFSCPHTSQQNGVAERKHRHIVDMALTLISQSSLPLNLWPYAFSTAVFLINRLPSVSRQYTSPWECLFGSTPDYKSFRVFGCTCYPLLRSYSRHKLQPRSVPCVFLGYASNAKGFLCYDCSAHRFYVSRHVKFDETSFPYKNLPSPPSNSSSSSSVTSHTSSIWLSHLLFFHPCSVPSILGPPPSNSSIPLVSSSIVPSVSLDSYTHSSSSSIPDLPTAPISDTQPAPLTPEVPTLVSAPLISSTNIHPMCTRAKSGITKRKPGFLATHTSLPGSLDYLNTEPTTYTIACKIPQWHAAMASEFAALQRQATWTLVPSSSSQHVIGCRWVFKLKRNADGSVARFKARLVAKGNHQQAGLDFDETFSPVVKPATVRLVLSLAAQYGWSLRQLDVSNAYLHGSLKEHVFMRQPPGFVDPNHPSHVCLLQKSIYGLRQAPRAWFEKFSSHLLTIGFTASLADPSLFVYKNGSTVIYLLLYVDDIILTGSVPAAIQELIRDLAQAFELKDLGPLKYFLGLQVEYTPSGLLVHQTKYATDLLAKHNMSTCKPCSTPFVPPSTSVLTESSLLSDPFSYRSLVGALQYLTFTRPDLSFAINSLCQHMHQPTTSHLVAAKRVLRYIRGTISHGILFQPGPLRLTAFTDSDWAGNPVDRRSSTEAEYRALAVGAAELTWIRMLLRDLGIFISHAPVLWCDNTSAISLASNPVFHARTKHVEIDYHFVREKVVRGDLAVQFISTTNQLADLLTKALPSPRYVTLSTKLLHSISQHSFEGG
uniref:Integrase catalytic domain-containing protein n=1 Tax=Fagus sylvatica TaxID=28930 RepID=A0A2N9E312_FAGSY